MQEYKCSKCDKKFISSRHFKVHLNQHIFAHGTETCSKCDKVIKGIITRGGSFKRAKDVLKEHVCQVHDSYQYNSTILPGTKKNLYNGISKWSANLGLGL